MAQEESTPNSPAQDAQAASAEATPDPKASAATSAGSPSVSSTAAETSGTSAQTAAPDTSASDESLRKHYVALAEAKASALRERKAREAAEARAKSFEEKFGKAKENPLAILEEAGLTYEQLTEHVLNQGREPTAEEKLAAKLAEIEQWKAAQEKAAQEAEAKRAEEAQKSQHQQAIGVIRQTLEAAGEAFELTRALGHEEKVLEAVAKYAQQHGIEQVTLDHVQAVAKAYEGALEEEFSGLFSKAKKLTRFAQPKAEANAQSGTELQGAKGTSSVTLASAKVSEAPPPKTGRRTPDELRAAALAILKGEASA